MINQNTDFFKYKFSYAYLTGSIGFPGGQKVPKRMALAYTSPKWGTDTSSRAQTAHRIRPPQRPTSEHLDHLLS